MNKIVYNVVGSTIKVIASSKVDVTKDLEQEDIQEHKTIAELLNEQKTEQSNNQK
jgi:hypothetical protein